VVAAYVLRPCRKREYQTLSSSGYDHLVREAEERDLLFRFQQQAHLYVRHPPSAGNLSSWFALMQHHGPPTRFLDWTKSPYVAAYFALQEEAEREEKRSAVWATSKLLLTSVGRTTAWPERGIDFSFLPAISPSEASFRRFSTVTSTAAIFRA